MNNEKELLSNDKFLSALRNLPKEKLEELIDFAEFLVQKEKMNKSSKKSNINHDPILDIIGIADEEPFANIIDHELYG